MPTEEYIDALFVKGITSIMSVDIPLKNDFDYVMSMQILMGAGLNQSTALKF